MSNQKEMVGVLIETYWNVKVDLSIAKQYEVIVLIETYWNVKKTSSREPKPSLSY